jgi:hypothetical protein
MADAPNEHLDVAQRASQRASRQSANWRLSSLFRPLSIYHTQDGDDQSSNEDGRMPHPYLSLGIPSIQPTTFDRLGSISPTSGLTSGSFAYRESGYNDHNEYGASCRTSHRSAAYHRAHAARMLSSDEEDSTDEAEQDELGKSVHREQNAQQVHEDEEDGVQGLVQRKPSLKHSSSLQRKPSAARSLAEKLSSDRLTRANSRRVYKRGSRVLSALPPLPDNMRSGDYSPARISESIYSEKSGRPSAAGQPTPPSGLSPMMVQHDPDLVLWDGPDDPGNPMNWSRSKKWASTFALGFVTFCVTFASSVFSPGTLAAAHEFDVSPEVMVLGTALYVLGFAFGPVSLNGKRCRRSH